LPVCDGLAADAELLFGAVREAGDLALTMMRQQVRRWSKADGSPVTESDLKVDALLAGKLRTNRPGYGWLSEETADDGSRLACARSWIVDPIDGTRAFIAAGSEWCVAAALVEGGRPIAAAIYRPVLEEFYAAVAGRGAALNGATLVIEDIASLDGAEVIGSKAALASLTDAGIVAHHRTLFPLQLRLALVAAGQIAATVATGHKNDWDLAAGDLLVHEAGGRVSDLAGRPLVYNRQQTWQQGMIATGRRRHDAILAALRTK